VFRLAGLGGVGVGVLIVEAVLWARGEAAQHTRRRLAVPLEAAAEEGETFVTELGRLVQQARWSARGARRLPARHVRRACAGQGNPAQLLRAVLGTGCAAASGFVAGGLSPGSGGDRPACGSTGWGWS